MMTTPPIRLPLGELAPSPSLFTHASLLHGQAHVSRVMVHAFRLIAATGWIEEAPRLWASVYLHDLARTHDGLCHRHGGDAMRKLETLPHLRTLFERGGVRDEDYPAIGTAVTHHSLPKELDRAHPHWRLTSLLKDADGLDRVRLGDLDPRYLRNPHAHAMVTFAQTLFAETNGIVPTGEDHFAVLWPEVLRLQS
jgi:hypothetical protein